MSGRAASGWNENYLAAAITGGAGTTAATMDRDSVLGSALGLVAVDPWTTSCEVRKVGTVSGSTLNVVGGAFLKNHAVGARILFFPEGAVNLAWYALKGDTSDANDVLQGALDDGTRAVSGQGSVWIDGQNKVYQSSVPILIPNGVKVRQVNITAHSTFTNTDANGGLVMNQNGVITQIVSADPVTDIITLAAAHGQPINRPIMFKGTSLPGGLVSGKTYYAKTINSTTTLTVSATLPAGVAGPVVDITSTGTGNAYCQHMSLGKLHIHDCVFNGAGLAGNVLVMDVQQQSDFTKLRCTNGTLASLVLAGQQGEFFDLQLLGSPTGLAMESASWMHFYGLNVEDGTFNTTRAVHSRAPQTWPWFNGGGALDAEFRAVHLENHSDANAVGFDLEAPAPGASTFLISGAECNYDLSTHKFLYSHGGISTCGWILEAIYFSSASPGPPGRPIAVHDPDRWSAPKYAWDTDGTNCRYISRWDGTMAGSSSTTYPERYPTMYFRKGGGYVGLGGQSDNVESIGIRVGSGQTADATQVKDKAGNTKTGVNQDGFLYLLTGVAGGTVTPDHDGSGGHLADSFTLTAHGLVSNQPVLFTGSPLPTGLSATTTYYVIPVDANTFQVSATSGPGALKTFTSNGTTVRVLPKAPLAAEIANGQALLSFDSTTGAARIVITAKDAGGTVRTGVIALS
jgi:hypothetical protein